MSIVKMVELELKMDVSEDMRAASMTASMRPLNPTGIFSFTCASRINRLSHTPRLAD